MASGHAVMGAGRRITRQARAVARVAKANVVRLRAPLKINLCLTYWCQYRCKTCNIWQRTPTDELTTAELLAFIDRNRETAWLDVTGGEIFLRKDLDAILDAIVGSWRHLAVLHFPTNGFLTDRILHTATRLAKTCRAAVVITVSLDGNEALNDDIRGVKGGFRRQIETFAALRRIRGIKTVLGMTLSSLNAGHFAETLEACRTYCPDLTIHDFHVNVAQMSGHYYGNAGMTHLRPQAAVLKQDLQLYRALQGMPTSVASWVERTYLNHLERFLDTGRTPMRCHALRSSCFIDPWGMVYPCITYDRPIGSLRTTDMNLAAVWNSEMARKVQAEIWSGSCPQCWTACEAYQSILGNVLPSWRLRAAPP